MKYKRKCNSLLIILALAQMLLGRWESKFLPNDPVRFYFQMEIILAVLALIAIEVFEYIEMKKFYLLNGLVETKEIQKELITNKIIVCFLFIILMVVIWGMFYGPILIIK